MSERSERMTTERPPGSRAAMGRERSERGRSPQVQMSERGRSPEMS